MTTAMQLSILCVLAVLGYILVHWTLQYASGQFL